MGRKKNKYTSDEDEQIVSEDSPEVIEDTSVEEAVDVPVEPEPVVLEAPSGPYCLRMTIHQEQRFAPNGVAYLWNGFIAPLDYLTDLKSRMGGIKGTMVMAGKGRTLDFTLYSRSRAILVDFQKQVFEALFKDPTIPDASTDLQSTGIMPINGFKAKYWLGKASNEPMPTSLEIK